MIELNHVGKVFSGKRVVQNMNLRVRKGSICGLLGSNGAGKSTLLKMLAGIITQDEGEIKVNQMPVYENIEVKNQCFYVADTPYFIPHYSIKQMAQFYQGMYANWDEMRFAQLHEVFPFALNQKIHKLSKGMQRQIAFWLALSTKPEVLILDEPFDGLDPVMRHTIRQLLIQDVADRDMTILVASHNLREIEDIADHVAILHNGSIILEKELDDLKTDIHKVQFAFKGKIPTGLYRGLNVLFTEKRGSVSLCIIRGEESEIINHFELYEPDIFDILPLTLEEIFIYEMRDIGYAIQNILD